jgi:hypothetical protein
MMSPTLGASTFRRRALTAHSPHYCAVRFYLCNFVGVLCTCLVMLGSSDDMFWLNTVFLLIANAFLGFGVVFYNRWAD